MDNQIILAGITADAIFTTLVTIFIFATGLFFKWRYDIYIENQKLEEIIFINIRQTSNLY